jgi:hypothetical protein
MRYFWEKFKHESSQERPHPLFDPYSSFDLTDLRPSIPDTGDRPSKDLGNRRLYGNSVIPDQPAQLLFAQKLWREFFSNHGFGDDSEIYSITRVHWNRSLARDGEYYFVYREFLCGFFVLLSF